MKEFFSQRRSNGSSVKSKNLRDQSPKKDREMETAATLRLVQQEGG
jgi:hypothetical protein